MGFFASNFSGLTSVRLLIASVVISGSSLLVVGQTVNSSSGQKTSPAIPATQVDPTAPRTNVDETFELNIDERRYSQENLEASTAVGTKDTGNLNLQVGVALAAGRIDVTLRNVHGRVRFRGTLDRILEVLNNRPTPSSMTPAPSPVRSPQ